jgi:hypothetical protein
MFNIIVGAGAVGAGAASRYGSGSNQKMRLLAAPAPQNWLGVLSWKAYKLSAKYDTGPQNKNRSIKIPSLSQPMFTEHS